MGGSSAGWQRSDVSVTCSEPRGAGRVSTVMAVSPVGSFPTIRRLGNHTADRSLRLGRSLVGVRRGSAAVTVRRNHSAAAAASPRPLSLVLWTASSSAGRDSGRDVPALGAFSGLSPGAESSWPVRPRLWRVRGGQRSGPGSRRPGARSLPGCSCRWRGARTRVAWIHATGPCPARACGRRGPDSGPRRPVIEGVSDRCCLLQGVGPVDGLDGAVACGVPHLGP